MRIHAGDQSTVEGLEAELDKAAERIDFCVGQSIIAMWGDEGEEKSAYPAVIKKLPQNNTSDNTKYELQFLDEGTNKKYDTGVYDMYPPAAYNAEQTCEANPQKYPGVLTVDFIYKPGYDGKITWGVSRFYHFCEGKWYRSFEDIPEVCEHLTTNVVTLKLTDEKDKVTHVFTFDPKEDNPKWLRRAVDGM